MFVLDCEKGEKTVTDFHQITNVVFCGYFYECVEMTCCPLSVRLPEPGKPKDPRGHCRPVQ